MKKGVRGWESAATYVSTFDEPALPDGVGACDVEVQVGTADGKWYIRTRDDCGGSDAVPEDASEFASEEEAVAAAREWAEVNDEASGASAEDYLEERLNTRITQGKAPKGRYALVSSQDGRRWDKDRYADLDAADLAVAQWYTKVQAAHPGTQILFHLMDTPVVAARIGDAWVPIATTEDTED